MGDAQTPPSFGGFTFVHEEVFGGVYRCVRADGMLHLYCLFSPVTCVYAVFCRVSVSESEDDFESDTDRDSSAW